MGSIRREFPGKLKEFVVGYRPYPTHATRLGVIWEKELKGLMGFYELDLEYFWSDKNLKENKKKNRKGDEDVKS